MLAQLDMTKPPNYFADLADDLARSGSSPGEILVELSKRGLSANRARSILGDQRSSQQVTGHRASRRAIVLGAALIAVGALVKLVFHLADSSDSTGVFTFTWAAIGFGSMHSLYGVLLGRRLRRQLTPN